MAEASPRFDRVKFAYHVTGFPCDEEHPNSPEMTTLLAAAAPNAEFSGPLFNSGLKMAYFSVSQYKRKLPTITIYPRTGEVRKRYWRVEVPIELFDEYEIYYCHRYFTANGDTQVLLLMVRPEELDAVEVLDGVTNDPEVVNQYLKRTWNKEIGCNSYTCPAYGKNKGEGEQQIFVNFAVLHDFKLIRWRDVEKAW